MPPSSQGGRHCSGKVRGGRRFAWCVVRVAVVGVSFVVLLCFCRRRQNDVLLPKLTDDHLAYVAPCRGTAVCRCVTEMRERTQPSGIMSFRAIHNVEQNG